MFDLGSAVKVEEERDSLGGGVLDANIYDFTLKLAYITYAASEAMAVNLVFEGAGGAQMKQTVYISSGKAKGKKFTYTDKNSGEERPLPGYSQINSLCMLAAGMPLNKMNPEKKVVGIYDYDEKKELPKETPVLMDLKDTKISIGVLKVLEDKQSKNSEGVYVSNGETREVNRMDKFFQVDTRATLTELSAGEDSGKFAGKWLTKNKDLVKDETTKPTGATGVSGVPSLGGNVEAKTVAPVGNLFIKK